MSAKSTQHQQELKTKIVEYQEKERERTEPLNYFVARRMSLDCCHDAASSCTTNEVDKLEKKNKALENEVLDLREELASCHKIIRSKSSLIDTLGLFFIFI